MFSRAFPVVLGAWADLSSGESETGALLQRNLPHMIKFKAL